MAIVSFIFHDRNKVPYVFDYNTYLSFVLKPFSMSNQLLKTHVTIIITYLCIYYLFVYILYLLLLHVFSPTDFTLKMFGGQSERFVLYICI